MPTPDPDPVMTWRTKQEKLRDRGDSRAVMPITEKNYKKFLDSYFTHTDPVEREKAVRREREAWVLRSIEDWLEDIEAGDDHEWGPSTKGVAAFAVANYYKTVHLISLDWKLLPYGESVSRRDDKFDPDIFTEREIRDVLGNLDTQGQERFVDAVVIGWATIARRSEIVEMRVEDVDLSKPAVTVRGKKRSGDYTFTPETPPISDLEWVPRSLWDCLENRVAAAESRGSEWLFPSGQDHLAATTLGTWFGRDLCRDELFGRWRGIHAFARHTRVTHLRARGYSIDDIQEWARHKHRQTTQQYNHPDILNRL